MGIFKPIRLYFKRKNILKKQSDHSIPNYKNYNPSKKTIVFINNSIPTPDKDSGSNRLKEIIISAKELNYNCIICTKKAYRTDKYLNHLSDLGMIVYVETNQYKNYFEFLKSIPKVDYVWHYGPNTLKDNLKKTAELLPDSKSIFDMVDIHFLRYKRSIQLDPTRISFRKKYRKYYKIETQLALDTDVIVAISEKEKLFMSQYLPDKKIIVISNIHYHKTNQENIPRFKQRNDLLFIGSTHQPNIDAIYYLHNKIMPLVWQQIPSLKVTIIGNVKEHIKTELDSRFKLTGFIEDIEPYFLNAKIMVAPLRTGAGVKGKIGQAFEYFLPVITTSIGAEGMFLENNKHAYIADNAEEFANQIISLYQDEEIWTKFSNNSTESLLPFSKEKLKSVLKEI